MRPAYPPIVFLTLQCAANGIRRKGNKVAIKDGLERMATAFKDEQTSGHTPVQSDAVVVRFAGDSGDGMQLTGGQFTLSSALAGNDFATFPDFPAEIRAPIGTLFGVSAFQINFGSSAIDTAGDQPDVLIAMNPAALKTNVGSLREGGLIIADTGE
ncbi:MAG: 2-oxoglutarate oxidoreductase subunit KorA, partial [Pseudomonadota bacterium]